MKKIEHILLPPNATIRKALEIIEEGAMKITLVVDQNQKLLGTLTDGDIRRGLLSDMRLDDEIEFIYYRTPTTCSINDSKEKVLQIAVARKLYQIPILDAEGRVVGIAEIDQLFKKESRANKVVLMAGGLGTRLSPLTDTLPKPMLHVGNKPILETIIESFVKYGYSDIILSVSYKSHIIEDYFGDGSVFGAKIDYIHESERMGTAGALSLMRDKLTEPFFVMNGDLLTKINFENMHDFHLSNEAVATMAVREYDFQVPYGVVNVIDSKIISIEEKPVHKFFVSAGIYMLSPQTLDYIPEKRFFDMPTLFDKLIIERKNTCSFPIREYWLDIGRMSDYEKANNEYKDVFE